MDHIRKVLGHRGIETTHGYVHYEAEQLRAVLALLGPQPEHKRSTRADGSFRAKV